MALNALDPRKAAALRDHLALCEGCRRYWEDISNVTNGLAAAAPDSNLEASKFSHHRVAEKLQASESGSVLVDSRINAELARGPAGHRGVGDCALGSGRATTPCDSLRAGAAHGSSCVGLRFRKRLGVNHQRVASQSLEKYSELLISQGNKSLPAAPDYTISTLELANGSF